MLGPLHSSHNEIRGANRPLPTLYEDDARYSEAPRDDVAAAFRGELLCTPPVGGFRFDKIVHVGIPKAPTHFFCFLRRFQKERRTVQDGISGRAARVLRNWSFALECRRSSRSAQLPAPALSRRLCISFNSVREAIGRNREAVSYSQF